MVKICSSYLIKVIQKETSIPPFFEESIEYFLFFRMTGNLHYFFEDVAEKTITKKCDKFAYKGANHITINLHLKAAGPGS
jgi:hypothetical protein